MEQGIIYCAKNIRTGKMYIGQTSSQLNARISQHYNDCIRRDYKFYRSLRNLNNQFIWGIIEECEKSKLYEREKYWIEYYNSYKNGYNSTLGGEGGVIPERCREFTLKSPEGKIINSINLNEFCKTNNLDFRNIQKVLSGKAKSHKGWTLPKTKYMGVESIAELNSKSFTLKSPEGNLFTSKNIRKFCRDNNLSRTGIRNVMNGTQKSHKGWTLP